MLVVSTGILFDVQISNEALLMSENWNGCRDSNKPDAKEIKNDNEQHWFRGGRWGGTGGKPISNEKLKDGSPATMTMMMVGLAKASERGRSRRERRSDVADV